jgi:hypothetical protein
MITAFTEVIPKEKLIIIPYSEKEKFLVLKKTKEQVLVSGLKEYLKNNRNYKYYKTKKSK